MEYIFGNSVLFLPAVAYKLIWKITLRMNHSLAYFILVSANWLSAQSKPLLDSSVHVEFFSYILWRFIHFWPYLLSLQLLDVWLLFILLGFSDKRLPTEGIRYDIFVLLILWSWLWFYTSRSWAHFYIKCTSTFLILLLMHCLRKAGEHLPSIQQIKSSNCAFKLIRLFKMFY